MHIKSQHWHWPCNIYIPWVVVGALDVVIILVGAVADVVLGDTIVVAFNAVEDYVSFNQIKSTSKYLSYIKLSSLS